MNTIIKYNNVEIGPPTPLVTLEREHAINNNKIGDIDRIKLIGQLTGNFLNLISGQNDLLNKFSNNFKTFEILEEDYLIGNLIGSNSIGLINNALGISVDWSSLKPATKYALFYKNKFNNIIDARDVNVFAENGNGVACCSLAKKILVVPGATFGSNYFSHGIYLSNSLGSIKAIFASSAFTSNITYYDQANLAYNLQADTFYLKEISNKIYEKSGVIINDINFSESKYNGILDYEISLTAKKFQFDVQNPVDQFSVSKENGTLTLNHRVSAQGINTSTTSFSNSLQNAISFVNQFTGINNLPSLYIEDTINLPVNNSVYHLLEVRESMNRIEGIYSIDESYIKDLNFDADQSGILRYTIDLNSGVDQNNITFSIKGSYSNSPINGNFNLLRNRFINTIKPSLTDKIIKNISGFYSGYVNPAPISYSINENSGSHTIDFQFEYDNLNLPNPYVIYTSNVSRDEITQIISININAEIIARGTSSNRYNLAQQYVSQVQNSMSSLATNIYNTFINLNNYQFSYPLRFVKSNRKDNQFLGKVSLSYSYDDKEMPAFVSDANYSVNQQLPVWYFSANPTLAKNIYIFQDFDIRTPLRTTYDGDFRFDQLLNISDGVARGMLGPIIDLTNKKIVNEKISVQKDKKGSLRSAKLTTEVVATTTGAFLPKSI